jgi:radical SAM superfamily enzyme YgiQ (UPF0313 family)/pyrimidine deaminase RibD-like protein
VSKYRSQASDRLHATLLALCNDDLTRQLLEQAGSPSPELAAYASRLCAAVLEYSAYRHSEDPKEDPFDDPYVGAALITSHGRLLGSHRKVSRNEPHAEPTAILDALTRVGSEEAHKLLRIIEDSYSEKIWLRGETDATMFATLFAAAGAILREFIEPDEQLILISTLEPCKDFETQPSCSRIISEFKPDLVLYGCDDTNAKGQGRSILRANNIRVMPNLTVDENLTINRLFYSSIHYLQKIHRAARDTTNGLNAFYVMANLDRLSVRSSMQEDRLHVSFDDPVDLPVYLGAVESRAPEIDILTFPSVAVDEARVLFINHLIPNFVATYLRRHLKNTGKIPGIIITSQATKSNRGTQRLFGALRRSGVRLYTDVLRKGDEHFIAVESIDRAAETVGTPDFLYVTVKHDTGYISFYGDHGVIIRQLLKLSAVRRVVMYFDRYSRHSFIVVVNSLKAAGAFESSHPLSKASFNVIVITNSATENALESQALREALRAENLGARFLVQGSIRAPQNKQGPERILADLASGRLDPIAIEPSQLAHLVDAPTWKGRQAAGWFLDAAVRRDPAVFESLITRALPTQVDIADWRRTCSLLNAIQRHGRPDERDRARLIARLCELAEALKGAVRNQNSPVLLDIVWRFIAASFAVAREPAELDSLLWNDSILNFIGHESFLLKELFFYSSTAFPVATKSIEKCFGVLNACAQNLSPISRLHVALRITRHAVRWSSDETLKSQLSDFFKANADVEPACIAEDRRCRLILDGGLEAVFSTPDISERSRMFATYLFQRTSRLDPGESGLVNAIQQEIANTMGATPRKGEELVSWRGDKTPLARLVLSEIPAAQLWSYITALGDDEDETIRWASLVLAFDSRIRARVLPPLSRASAVAVRRATSEVVNRVFASVSHYWLQREFVHLFCKEHSVENTLPLEARVQTIDVTAARNILAGRKSDQWHPEVLAEQTNYKNKFKKVALVLPPLQLGQISPPVSTSTPPLGLASIGTYLLTEGHDVSLLDCHRYPDLARDIVEHVRDCDFVAFSALASTFSSTELLSATIRTQLGPRAPVVVIGGQGVTLQTRDFLEHRSMHWDYLVVGDGELSLANIVKNHQPHNLVHGEGIIRRTERTLVLPKFLSAAEWDQLPWINRQLFRDPRGSVYEPASTRGGMHKEAHIIMSRGCEWRCSFCTEAVLRGGAGEVRRSAEDVLNEITYLTSAQNATRVQFIDDNLFPQVATAPQKASIHFAYAEHLLDGLSKIKHERHNFGWRGIFRFEDFMLYQARVPKWLVRLKDAGCMLLAFGVEHGLEERRRRLKAGTITNDEIVNVVQSLSQMGIATKGYFIIGGPGESEFTSNATSQFAVEAGFTLAYFAIYKHFRSLVSFARKHGSNDETRHKMMSFGLLAADLEERVMACVSPQDWANAFGETVTAERVAEAQKTVERLRIEGFKFGELFKYNDFHDGGNDPGSFDLWEGKSGTTELLNAVRRAYAKFYLRPVFIETFRNLVANGY